MKEERPPETGEALVKFLANCRVASRRKSEVVIRNGRVKVNGVVVIDPAFRVRAGKDRIDCDGKPVVLPGKRYLILNKPAGCITTVSDTHGRTKVVDLIPDAGGLFPVGRLDQDTTGLLLLTNDGALAYRLMHPSFEVEKIYRVTLKDVIRPETIRRLESGIAVDGRMTAPARIRLRAGDGKGSELEVRIHEGRKRQVKLMFAAVGHAVTKLSRVGYANLRLENLKPGEWRELTETEVEALKELVGGSERRGVNYQ